MLRALRLFEQKKIKMFLLSLPQTGKARPACKERNVSIMAV